MTALIFALWVHWVLWQASPVIHQLLGGFRRTLIRPSPAPVETLSLSEVMKLKQQWKEQSRSLVLDSKAPPTEQAKKDSQFESDRNRSVERETRAHESLSSVLPALPKHSNRSPPGLSNLGLKLPSPSKVAPSQSQDSIRAQPSSGGSQTILDDRLTPGAENLLNTVESKYYTFYSRLYEAIAPIWESRIKEIPTQRQVPPGDYTTLVTVTLDDQGNLVHVKVTQGSQIPEFDRAAEDSWRRIGRFPNPPQGLLNLNRQAEVTWSYHIRVGRGVNTEFLPPVPLPQ